MMTFHILRLASGTEKMRLLKLHFQSSEEIYDGNASNNFFWTESLYLMISGYNVHCPL